MSLHHYILNYRAKESHSGANGGLTQRSVFSRARSALSSRRRVASMFARWLSRRSAFSIIPTALCFDPSWQAKPCHPRLCPNQHREAPMRPGARNDDNGPNGQDIELLVQHRIRLIHQPSQRGFHRGLATAPVIKCLGRGIRNPSAVIMPGPLPRPVRPNCCPHIPRTAHLVSMPRLNASRRRGGQNPPAG